MMLLLLSLSLSSKTKQKYKQLKKNGNRQVGHTAPASRCVSYAMVMMMIHDKSETVVYGCAGDMVVCMHVVMATTQGWCKDVSTLLLVLF